MKNWKLCAIIFLIFCCILISCCKRIKEVTQSNNYNKSTEVTQSSIQYEKSKSNITYIGKLEHGMSVYYIDKIKIDSSEYIIVSGYPSVTIVKHK